MKKIFLVIVSAVVLCCCSLAFFACDKSDKTNVLMNREVDAISMYLYDSQTTYNFTSDERTELIGLLKQQEKLQYDARVDLGTTTSYTPVNRLDVTTKKKIFKKSQSFSVIIGRSYVVKKNSDKSVVRTGTDDNYLGAQGYYGVASDKLVEFVNEIRERENDALSQNYYATVKSALVADGYKIVAASAYDSNYPSSAKEGFYATKSVQGDNASYGWLSCYLFATNQDANSYYSANSNGGLKYRVYYIGNSVSYALLGTISASAS